MIPKKLRYTEDHEWVLDMGDGKVRVGITDYAQTQLGDVVFVELPEVDDEVEAGEAFGSVESTKTVSDMVVELDGTIVAINEKLEDNPGFVNESPYAKGWMVEIQLSDVSQLDNLLTADQYDAIVPK